MTVTGGEQIDLFGGSPDPQPTKKQVDAGLERLGNRLAPYPLYLGTCSWSFPGWDGLVYHGQRDKTLLAREGSTLRVAYNPGVNEECATCVIPGPDLANMMKELVREQDASITEVVVVEGDAEDVRGESPGNHDNGLYARVRQQSRVDCAAPVSNEAGDVRQYYGANDDAADNG